CPAAIARPYGGRGVRSVQHSSTAQAGSRVKRAQVLQPRVACARNPSSRVATGCGVYHLESVTHLPQRMQKVGKWPTNSCGSARAFGARISTRRPTEITKNLLVSTRYCP